MKFLGTVTIPSGVSRNNTSTAVPFLIDKPGFYSLRLLTADANLSYELTYDDASPSAKTTDAAKGFPLTATVAENVKTGRMQMPAVLSVFNGGGGAQSLRVWITQKE